MIKQVVNEVKAELKPTKVIALFVVLVILAYAIGWLSKRSALVAKINPLSAK